MALPDKVKDAWGSLADLMAEDMKRDGLRWMREWACAEPPCNGVSQVPYKGKNALLLLAAMRKHGFEDPRFLTYNAAKQAGFQVRKGEKSCAIIEKWKMFAISMSDPDKRIPQPKTEEEWRQYQEDPDIAFRVRCVGYFNLFNASQIDGMPAYEAVNRISYGDLGDNALDVMEAMSPCSVTEMYQDRAFYSPATDEIVMPSRALFSTSEGFARTLLHEQGHATGAASRLGREMGRKKGDDKYAREELVAELSALFSANALGIRMDHSEDGGITDSAYWQNHAAYLKSWSSNLDDPAAELRAASSQAAKASEFIVSRYQQAGILENWRTVDARGLKQDDMSSERSANGVLENPSPSQMAAMAIRAASDCAKGDSRAQTARRP